MKLSEISKEDLLALSAEQKWNFICSDIKDQGDSGEVALLLGTRPEGARERALAAAKLYNSGRVKYIVPSGGVCWAYEGNTISEAELMTKILIEEGVPEDVIIIENEAKTTRENMIYGTLQINRKNKFYGVDTVIIVTTLIHMKRSYALALAYLPRKVKISSYPSYPAQKKEEWLKSEENTKLLNNEISFIKSLVDNRIIDDMEVNI